MAEIEKDEHIILRLDELKSELSAVVDNAVREKKIPYYMLEMILSRIYVDVFHAAQSELNYLKGEHANASVEKD